MKSGAKGLCAGCFGLAVGIIWGLWCFLAGLLFHGNHGQYHGLDLCRLRPNLCREFNRRFMGAITWFYRCILSRFALQRPMQVL
jgi:hypothetical protein